MARKSVLLYWVVIFFILTAKLTLKWKFLSVPITNESTKQNNFKDPNYNSFSQQYLVLSTPNNTQKDKEVNHRDGQG